MPWKETCALDERIRFIEALTEGVVSFSKLCRWFGVSRKTGYKWVARWRAEGSVLERSRAPRTSPHRVPPDVIERLVAARRARPHEGPRKILLRLRAQDPDVQWPSASTVDSIFRKQGLVVSRAVRHRATPSPKPLTVIDGPNAVWSADFKGAFWTRMDGRKCEPFTASDLFSRYLLSCRALRRNDGDRVREALEAAFDTYGLPAVLRTDNGPPFASVAPGGLSKLAVWLIQVGIKPERIEPGRPTQNGRHERIHRTMKEATASPPANTLQEQQRRFDVFRRDYNEERPHDGLGGRTPSMLYAASARPFRGPQPLTYPEDFERRCIRPKGFLRWRGRDHYISEVFAGLDVGVEEVTNDEWRLWYADVVLGSLLPQGFARRK